MKKRVLALFVAAVMLFGTMPVSALTAENAAEAVTSQVQSSIVQSEAAPSGVGATAVPQFNASAGVAVQAATVEGTNLLTNGDFSNANGTGWSVTAVAGKNAKVEIGKASTYGLTGSDNLCELNYENAQVIYQTVSAQAGDVFKLKFDFAGRSNVTIPAGQTVFSCVWSPAISIGTNDYAKFDSTSSSNLFGKGLNLFTHTRTSGSTAVIDSSNPVIVSIPSGSTGSWNTIEAIIQVTSDMVSGGKMNVGIATYSPRNSDQNAGCGNLLDNVSLVKLNPVASVGGKGYMTLQEAINAAPEGGTVTILRDFTHGELASNRQVSVNKNLTIDGAKHTITEDTGKNSGHLFSVNNNKTLTIKNLVLDGLVASGLLWGGGSSNPNANVILTNVKVTNFVSGSSSKGQVMIANTFASITMEAVSIENNTGYSYVMNSSVAGLTLKRGDVAEKDLVTGRTNTVYILDNTQDGKQRNLYLKDASVLTAYTNSANQVGISNPVTAGAEFGKILLGYTDGVPVSLNSGNIAFMNDANPGLVFFNSDASGTSGTLSWFDENYQINYHGNGGIDRISKKETVEIQMDAMVPSTRLASNDPDATDRGSEQAPITAFARVGYKFLGWASYSAAESPITGLEDGISAYYCSLFRSLARITARPGDTAETGIGPYNLYAVWKKTPVPAVYVASTGSDSNLGTPDSPFGSLGYAYSIVDDGGIIYVMDDLTNIDNAGSTNSANIGTEGKSATICGIAYDASKSDPNVPKVRTLQYAAGGNGTQGIIKANGGNLTLKYLTLNGKNSGSNADATCLYVASGATVTLGESVSLINPGKGYSASGKDFANVLGTLNIAAPLTLSGDGQLEGGGNINRSSTFTSGQMLQITGGIVTMKNITVDGCNVSLTGSGANNLIAVTGGTLNLQSGAVVKGVKVTASTQQAYKDAAIYVNGQAATLNMYDGAKITGNSNTSGVAAVLLDNTAGTSNTFNMYGGEISGNVGKNTILIGSGAGRTFNMSGGKICNNSGGSSSYALYVGSGSSFNMTGGEVSGNTSQYGVYVYNATVTLDQNASITGNTYNGNASNLYLASAYPTVKSTFTGTVGICGEPGVIAAGAQFATAEGSPAITGFTNDVNAGYTAKQEGTSLIWTFDAVARTSTDGGSTWTEYESLKEAIAAVPENNGSTTTNIVELLKDTTESGTGVEKRKFTLRSANGGVKTLTYNSTYLNLVANSNSEVTLKDITIDGNGGYTSVIAVRKGTVLNIQEGTTITGRTAVDGAGVWINGGTVNMTGGTITGNTVSNYGAGVSLDHYDGVTGTFNMSGGIVTGNTLSESGGYAAGVYVKKGNKVNISGTAQITGNQDSSGNENNLYLQDAADLTLSGDFTGSVGVCKPTGKGEVFGAVASGVTYSKGFTNDVDTTLKAVQEGNSLKWQGAPVAELWENGKRVAEYDTIAAAVAAYDNSRNALIRMVADVTETVNAGNAALSPLNIDLNGHHVTVEINSDSELNMCVIDSATDGYDDKACGSIICSKVAIGKQTISKNCTGAGKDKMYYVLDNGNGAKSSHRFNTTVYKYEGVLYPETGTGVLDFYLGFQGDSAVIGHLTKLSAGVKFNEGTTDYVIGSMDKPSDLRAATTTQNPYIYKASLVNITMNDGTNGFTAKYDLIAQVQFDGQNAVNSSPVTRSFLQILKLAYEKYTNEQKAAVDAFIQNNNLSEEWSALG